MTQAPGVRAVPPLVDSLAVSKWFGRQRSLLGGGAGAVRAVDRVTLGIAPGETVGLVGESGCGKSTLGRMMVGLTAPTSGAVRFEGRDLAEMRGSARHSLSRRLQPIFQDPLGSLDPRFTVSQSLTEPLRAHRVGDRTARRARVEELLDLVGLERRLVTARPGQLSGGQRQRVVIARALALTPKFVVADEPVSALDVSVQAQIVNLLDDLQQQLGVAFLFISHDLAVVRHAAARVGVMYLGKLVETGPTEAVLAEPLHPYTVALRGSVLAPVVGERRRLTTAGGDVGNPPTVGCVFRMRCPHAQEVCAEQTPDLRGVGAGRTVACHFVASDPLELLDGAAVGDLVQPGQ